MKYAILIGFIFCVSLTSGCASWFIPADELAALEAKRDAAAATPEHCYNQWFEGGVAVAMKCEREPESDCKQIAADMFVCGALAERY